MAQLDVTELMSDADFVDTVFIVTRTPSINSFGQNLLKEVSCETIGVVQPATGKDLQRLPEALRESDVSSFWVKGQVVALSPAQYTDILVFRGKRYQVKTVFDWTNWGPGYCEGLCVAEKPST